MIFPCVKSANTKIRIHKYTNTQTHKYTNTKIQIYNNVSSYPENASAANYSGPAVEWKKIRNDEGTEKTTDFECAFLEKYIWQFGEIHSYLDKNTKSQIILKAHQLLIIMVRGSSGRSSVMRRERLVWSPW